MVFEKKIDTSIYKNENKIITQDKKRTTNHLQILDMLVMFFVSMLPHHCGHPTPLRPGTWVRWMGWMKGGEMDRLHCGDRRTTFSQDLNGQLPIVDPPRPTTCVTTIA